jgi:rRNA maturation RNase YbeY
MTDDKIQFFYEDNSFKIHNKRKIREWLTDSATNEKRIIEQLNIIFCDDSYLLKINIEYLDHNYYTDIITFDNSVNDNNINGDIFISIERAKENSIEYQQDFEQELNRLMIHGLLHLIGYSDKLPKDKLRMTKKEDYYLIKLI